MSCDITIFAEVRIKKSTSWRIVDKKVFSDFWGKTIHPFGDRNYGIFGFLADVRNYSDCPCIKKPMGLPLILSDEVQVKYDDQSQIMHSASYLTLENLLAFDYDKKFINRRSEDQLEITVREFLGKRFFKNLKELSKLGEPKDVRIIFWFDN